VGLLPNSSSLNGSTTALLNLLPRYPEFPVGDSSGGWSGSSGVLNSLRTRAGPIMRASTSRRAEALAGAVAIVNYGWSRLTEQDTWLNDSDPQLERRISPFDHPQRIVMALTYDLPWAVGGRLTSIRARWTRLSGAGT